MNHLEDKLRQAMDTFQKRKAKGVMENVQIQAADPWRMKLLFTLDGRDFVLRSLDSEDAGLLLVFREQLSPKSRAFFAPYPWDDPEKLQNALTNTVANSINHVDASYVLACDAVPIGHCFLWKATQNTLSQKHNLQVPELGIALADNFQGQGLGSLLMLIMQAIGETLNADAIELTTALNNEPGFATYKNAGYEHIGEIATPAEVDVTAVAEGKATANEFHIERHMVLMLKTEKDQEVKKYLVEKQKLFDELAQKARSAKR